MRDMSTTPPQFGTAEYKSAASGETCRACKQTITGEYYRVNGVQACAACVGKVKEQMPKDTHAAFMRGMLFGVGGAIAGLIVYSVFGIVTGIVIGYVSLAVGWLVGKAIRAGSKGVGGRRYQIAAVLLTYAAGSIGALLFAGLASPFLELGDEPGGIIGLVILFVGMNIAWKLTAGAKLDIVGPFKASEPAAAG